MATSIFEKTSIATNPASLSQSMSFAQSFGAEQTHEVSWVVLFLKDVASCALAIMGNCLIWEEPLLPYSAICYGTRTWWR